MSLVVLGFILVVYLLKFVVTKKNVLFIELVVGILSPFCLFMPKINFISENNFGVICFIILMFISSICNLYELVVNNNENLETIVPKLIKYTFLLTGIPKIWIIGSTALAFHHWFDKKQKLNLKFLIFIAIILVNLTVKSSIATLVIVSLISILYYLLFKKRTMEESIILLTIPFLIYNTSSNSYGFYVFHVTFLLILSFNVWASKNMILAVKRAIRKNTTLDRLIQKIIPHNEVSFELSHREKYRSYTNLAVSPFLKHKSDIYIGIIVSLCLILFIIAGA